MNSILGAMVTEFLAAGWGGWNGVEAQMCHPCTIEVHRLWGWVLLVLVGVSVVGAEQEWGVFCP